MTAPSLLTATETACRIADEVRVAAARSTPLRIRGGGLWMDAGAPVDATQVVSLANDSGIVEYVPGDLTLTALAGTTISEINSVVAADAQWLALDPFGASGGTIGATIATASYGPLAQMYGTPRDQLLGVEFVTGAGDVVRGGGRVTKNVAGFDLTRLVCGAWGTLGVITEVTLRLRALPESDETLAVPLSVDATGLMSILARLRDVGVMPAAMELLDARICEKLSIECGPGARAASVLLVRFCGNEAGVRVQAKRLRDTAPSFDCPTTAWKELTEADLDAADNMVLRLSSRPGQLAKMWEFATNMATRFSGSHIHACVGRGTVRCTIPATWQAQIASLLASRPPGGIIIEKLPAALWPVLAPPEALADRLSTRVRDAFDPHRILNRGILGEGPP